MLGCNPLHPLIIFVIGLGTPVAVACGRTWEEARKKFCVTFVVPLDTVRQIIRARSQPGRYWERNNQMTGTQESRNEDLRMLTRALSPEGQRAPLSAAKADHWCSTNGSRVFIHRAILLRAQPQHSSSLVSFRGGAISHGSVPNWYLVHGTQRIHPGRFPWQGYSYRIIQPTKIPRLGHVGFRNIRLPQSSI